MRTRRSFTYVGAHGSPYARTRNAGERHIHARTDTAADMSRLIDMSMRKQLVQKRRRTTIRPSVVIGVMSPASKITQC
eukprot:6202225-Pleurochrysis_carterae.AAC.3